MTGTAVSGLDLPMHGRNLFPEHPAGLRRAVLEYMDRVTALGQTLLRGMSIGLGLEETWFEAHLTAEPLVLFRIFHYPPLDGVDERWSVGEHTDYGLITILAQDASGGLEVRGPTGWITAPPVEGSFVVNLGDMLERMTGGRYRSTPHRVHNASGLERLSFPLFLDPGWDAEVLPVPMVDGGVVRRRWRTLGRRGCPRLVRHLRRVRGHQGEPRVPGVARRGLARRGLRATAISRP